MKKYILNVDIEKILDAIQLWEACSNKNASYCIMNARTLEVVKSQKNYNAYERKDNMTETVFAVPIAICSSLDFGVVDIR